jgi:hypothetical protein
MGSLCAKNAIEKFSRLGTFKIGNTMTTCPERLFNSLWILTQDGDAEDPEEEPVQHHRHVLPVLLHLQTDAL